jgi:integrase
MSPGHDGSAANSVGALYGALRTPGREINPVPRALISSLAASEMDRDDSASVHIGKPTKAGHRSVPLGPQVVNTLREWKLACPKGEDGLLFPTPTGDIALHNNVVRAFVKAVCAAGLTNSKGKPKYKGLHSLRHFYASWCINPADRGGQGLPPKVVQQLLGHSSIVMTMDTYGHLFPADEDADKRLADAERVLLG